MLAICMYSLDRILDPPLLANLTFQKTCRQSYFEVMIHSLSVNRHCVVYIYVP